MTKSRFALLVASAVVVLLLLGSGWVARVGASDEGHNQVILFTDVLSRVVENYVDPVDPQDLMSGAYEGMSGSLDSRGAFLGIDEVAAWREATNWRDAGPGVSVLKGYGILQVVAVHDGSPAEEAGMRPGDQIRRIDGADTRDLSLDQARRLLGGEAGTTTRLEIVRPDDGFRRQEMEVQRERRDDRPYDLDVQRGIGIVSVADLDRTTAADLGSDLDDLRSGGVERVLLDLRNVVEGGPREAAAVASLFHAGSAFALRDRAGEVLETIDLDPAQETWAGEVGLLVNGATAGGAEALALLLRETRGAQVLGEETFGLSSEPRLFELPDGSGVLLSTSAWGLASGETWSGSGIEPDLVVRASGNDVAERLERQLAEAVDAFAGRGDAEAPEA
jgi:carboxyl-terminal processing protease